MGRASLLQVSRERIQALSHSAPPTPEQPQRRMELATLCVDAAKATIELILVLKKHNLLCRFSFVSLFARHVHHTNTNCRFTDHHASAAALIILILHSILQHGDETSRIIDDGIDMLRYMAHGGCRGASSDLHTIEQLKRLASELRQKIYHGEGDSSVGVSMQPTSITTSFQAWVNWMSEQEGPQNHETGRDDTSSRLDPETLQSTSEMRAHERAFMYEFGANNNVVGTLDYRWLDQGNASWNFDAFNASNLQGEVPRGFEWDDGRLDVLDMTQLLGGYTGETIYGQV
jgi:hypothetical protein